MAGFGWFEKLRTSSGLEEAAIILAQALGEETGALDVGVFLLDNTRRNLIFFASWSAAFGPRSEGKEAVPVDNLDEALGLALRQGGPVSVKAHPGTHLYSFWDMPGDGKNAAGSSLFAWPLLAWDHAAIGGVILRSGPQASSNASSFMLSPTGKNGVNTLSAYASLVFAGFEQRALDNARIASLQDDVARLERADGPEEAAVSTLLVGQSIAMRAVREQILQVAPYAVSVLITGETGTGKELAASAIHAASPRARAPFVKINCGALPSQLLESELFGHKKGAFSGAVSDHPGLLRSADGGTVLLDEIGDMPLELQVKLLRVLQEREVRPVGDVRSYPVDIRLIAVTNRNIKESVDAGEFRKDLYYRLAASHIHMPSLREHREDIPSLAALFLERFAKKNGIARASIEQEQMLALCGHDFPGNVRELISLVEDAAISMNGGPFRIRLPGVQDSMGSTSLGERVELYELSLINAAVASHDGNVSRAAKALGIPRTSLITKMNKSRAARRQD